MSNLLWLFVVIVTTFYLYLICSLFRYNLVYKQNVVVKTTNNYNFNIKILFIYVLILSKLIININVL